MVVIELLAVAIIGSVVVAGLAYFREKRREDRGLRHTPVVAIERASETYRVAQGLTRDLEHLLDDPMVSCTIPVSVQERARKHIDEFYNL